MVLRLNRTATEITRTQRNLINDNWQSIENNFNNVVQKISENALNEVVNSARLNWLQPVNTFSDLITVYPNASEGDAVFTREVINGVNRVYRYNGSEWSLIQEITADAINEVDNRLTSRIDMIDISNAINPDVFPGTDRQKIQSAINLTNNSNKKTIVFGRFFDITGEESLIINKNNRESLYLVGNGGGIIKNDTGYVFSSSFTDTGDIYSQGMIYRSVIGANTTIWNCNLLIRIFSVNDTYFRVDHGVEYNNRWLQSVKFIGCTITGGEGWFVEGRGTFDSLFYGNTIEERDGFMRSTYLYDFPFGFDNTSLRIRDNVIEGLSGKAIYIGSCKATTIDGNYFEGNAGGYIDLSANPANILTSHAGLSVKNNTIDALENQVNSDDFAIDWGFTINNVTSEGNSSNMNMHKTDRVTDAKVISSGDRISSSGNLILTDNVRKVYVLGSQRLQYIDVPLASGWGGSIRYARDKDGFIHLLIRISNGTTAFNTNIGNILNSDDFPFIEHVAACTTLSNLGNDNVGISVRISTQGQIFITGEAKTSLNGSTIYQASVL